MGRVKCEASVQGKCAGCGGKHVAKDDRSGLDLTIPYLVILVLHGPWKKDNGVADT